MDKIVCIENFIFQGNFSLLRMNYLFGDDNEYYYFYDEIFLIF